MFDIDIKKGLRFRNKYIFIISDGMYVSDYTKNILVKKFGDKNGLIKIATKDHRLYTITFKKHGNKSPEWVVCMSCGDYTYPNFYHNKSYTIGVRKRRVLIRKIIEMCRQTPIARDYKLENLLS